MNATDFAPRSTMDRSPKPPSRQQNRARARMDDKDNDRLIRRLEGFADRWEQNEGALRIRDRRGMRMWRGDVTASSGFGSDDSLSINSPTPTALFDRVAAEALRGMPEPEIEAHNEEEDDAARIAQGALRTNWRNTEFADKTAVGYRLAGFTRPIGFYHYWRHELLGGIGDVDRRMIPAHRLIVDDRTAFVRDMEFIGFEEEMSRAKLITLFPDKAEEIEAAGEVQANQPGGLATDPLKPNTALGAKGGSAVVDRLVAAGKINTPPYTPVASIKSGGKSRQGDPLSETVKVRFLWIDDPTPKKEQRPRLDPKTKQPLYTVTRDEFGAPAFESGGYEVIQTPLGPQYVEKSKPQYEMVMDDVIVRKYKYKRHVAYVPTDRVLLWDVAWDGPVPISILRDRWPAYGFDAAGSALRMGSLSVARDVLWTIIFQRLRKSLAGTWIASVGSGLKRNKLINDIGAVFEVRGNISEAVKEFPMSPLDAAYFNLLDKIETEMEMLIGVTPVMKGQPVGRADSPQTYEQVADQSGGPILDRAKLIDRFVKDAAEIDLWFMQTMYTHEHVVEYETAEGFSTWKEASALVMRGKLAVRVETGSTLGRSASRDRQEANDNAAAGFYALPMLGKMGRVRNWRQGLKQRAAIMRLGPQYSWMLGASGAPPTVQAKGIHQQSQRSHHKPGGR